MPHNITLGHLSFVDKCLENSWFPVLLQKVPDSCHYQESLLCCWSEIITQSKNKVMIRHHGWRSHSSFSRGVSCLSSYNHFPTVETNLSLVYCYFNARYSTGLDCLVIPVQAFTSMTRSANYLLVSFMFHWYGAVFS